MKWLKRLLLGTFAIVAIATMVVYAWSSLIIHRSYEAEPRNVLTSSRPDVMARARFTHLADDDIEALHTFLQQR